MLKTLDVLLVVIMLAAAAWTFAHKYQAETLEHEVALLDRKIAGEHETIQLLEADWSLLNQPRRMERLARAFEADLKLEPIDAQQIVAPNQLPAAAEPVAPEPLSGRFADAGTGRGR